MGEIKGQLMQAANYLDQDAAGKVNGANQDAMSAIAAVQGAFEGTGRQEFLELSGKIAQLQITLDDVLLNLMGAANELRDAAAMM